jgi:hypothetical protein
MNHLEQLVYEYYDWMGYLVKNNVHVGKLKKGGYEMELDIIAYNPHKDHLIHIEVSLDAFSWETRSKRYFKKFNSGKKYIFSEIFTWLDVGKDIDQLIISVNKTQNGLLNEVKIITVDDFMKIIIDDIKKVGKAVNAAIPEQYPLLRTIQFCFCGYNITPKLK